MQAFRRAKLSRKTKETDIELSLSLDGDGKNDISTGFGFLDHMLDLCSFWGGLDLKLRCKGDLDIDAHHTAEDIGIVFGQAFREALGDAKGIERCADCKVPMDEALAEVSVDISGRSWLEWRGDDLLPSVIAGEEKDLWREFFKAFSSSARMNIHITFCYGRNGHHLLESAFKGFGRCLKHAVMLNGTNVPSTKGIIEL